MIYTRTYEEHAITLNNHYEGWHIQEWEQKEKLHTYPLKLSCDYCGPRLAPNQK